MWSSSRWPWRLTVFSKQCPWDLSNLLHVLITCLFLWLSSIPWYECTTAYLRFPPLKDRVCFSDTTNKTTVNIGPKVHLMGYMVSVCVALYITANNFQSDYIVIFSEAMDEWSSWSTFLPTPGIINILFLILTDFISV